MVSALKEYTYQNVYLYVSVSIIIFVFPTVKVVACFADKDVVVTQV